MASGWAPNWETKDSGAEVDKVTFLSYQLDYQLIGVFVPPFLEAQIEAQLSILSHNLQSLSIGIVR